MTLKVLSLTFVAAAVSFAATPEEFFRAIRANDLGALKQLSTNSADVKAADKRGMTPLHYAAAYGNLQSLEILLAAGADPNARNTFGATPLVLGALDSRKIMALLAAKADPKIATKMGRTPLMIAAACSGMTPAVKALIDAGADINSTDERGSTALVLAAGTGDLETVRLLLAKGAKPDQADKANVTPLMASFMAKEPERTQIFLNAGANPNTANTFGGMVKFGPIALTKMTPLILAAAQGSVETVRAVIKAGANVNAQDDRGMTPLMVAVASEDQNQEIIRMLIEARANVNANDGKGDSVLDWARKVQDPNTIKQLTAAGAKGREIPVAPVRSKDVPAYTAEVAVQKAGDLLLASRREFFKQSGCNGCHHQPISSVALRAAKRAPEAAEIQATVASNRPLEPLLLQFVSPGGDVDSVGNVLLGFAADNVPAEGLTDAGASFIAARQSLDGGWKMYGINRPPFEDSNITRTMVAIRALKAWSWPARQAEFDERIARAKAWLLKAEPQTPYEKADRLLGLQAAGASTAELDRAAKSLLRDQHTDGGWSQNKHLASDAYATGLALHALNVSGRVSSTEPAYKKGVTYLLSTQLEDGSWYVRSRSAKFQPHFQSGFPHDHDQWISATATAYAVMALSPTVKTQSAALTAVK